MALPARVPELGPALPAGREVGFPVVAGAVLGQNGGREGGEEEEEGGDASVVFVLHFCHFARVLLLLSLPPCTWCAQSKPGCVCGCAFRTRKHAGGREWKDCQKKMWKWKWKLR